MCSHETGYPSADLLQLLRMTHFPALERGTPYADSGTGSASVGECGAAPELGSLFQGPAHEAQFVNDNIEEALEAHDQIDLFLKDNEDELRKRQEIIRNKRQFRCSIDLSSVFPNSYPSDSNCQTEQDKIDELPTIAPPSPFMDRTLDESDILAKQLEATKVKQVARKSHSRGKGCLLSVPPPEESRSTCADWSDEESVQSAWSGDKDEQNCQENDWSDEEDEEDGINQVN